MDLDLRLVRYFVVVADELHFGRAANKLHISQPALSKQIRKLEDQLGARLFVRDSRHVALTARGEAFLRDARELLILAERMQERSDGNRVRIAHIFELATSRDVADEYTKVHPDVTIVEHAIDSVAQLDALLENRLDVAILRVTPQMLHDHPKGWSHTLLRLEPMRLVGRRGDSPRSTASMFERPIEVLGDPPDSGLHEAYADFLTALERSLGLSMRWLGTPGAFSHCLAVIERATTSRVLPRIRQLRRALRGRGSAGVQTSGDLAALSLVDCLARRPDSSGHGRLPGDCPGHRDRTGLARLRHRFTRPPVVTPR